MDPLEWILAFVDQISAPAKAMTGSIHELVQALRELQGVADKLKPISLPGSSKSAGGGVAKQANELQKFANMWQRIGMKMQAEEHKRAQAFADIWEKIGAKMASQQAKAAAQAQRAAAKAAKAAAAEAEKASHKSYFGGHTNIRGLLAAQAEHKISGMATGAAGALLGAPGAILGGAVSVFGSAASGAAEIAFNLGKAAIAAQSMREDSVEAMTKLFRSSDAANQLFDVARKAAKETKFDTADVVKSFTTLATGGFKANEVEKVFWTVADIESKTAGKGEIFTRALNKLKGGGGAAAFGAFQSAATAGPGLTQALPELSKQLGLNKTLSRLEAMALFRKGKVSSDIAINSLLESTNHLLNTATGKAGEFAKKLGGTTWAGIISNIQNALGDVLNMELPSGHPIYDFKKFLQAIGAPGGLLDSSSARGKEFEKIISDVVADIFRLIGLDTKDINGSMDAILKLGREAQQTFSKFVDYVRKEVYPAVSGVIQDLNSGKVDDALGKFAARIAWIMAKGIGKGILTAIYATGPGIENKTDTIITPWNINKKSPGSGNAAAGEDYIPTELGGLRKYGSGGIVPGPVGKPRLAIVHGGEKYMGTESASPGWMMGGGGGKPTLEQHIHFHGDASGEESSIKNAVKQGGLEAWLEFMELSAAAQGVQR